MVERTSAGCSAKVSLSIGLCLVFCDAGREKQELG